MSSALNAWSRVLLVVLGVLCAASVLVLGWCVAIIVADELDDTDDWDGFGTLIGAYGGALASLVLAAVLALFAFLRSARTTGSRRQILLVAGICTYIGVAWLGWTVHFSTYGGDATTSILSGVGALALLVPASASLVTAARSSRVDGRV